MFSINLAQFTYDFPMVCLVPRLSNSLTGPLTTTTELHTCDCCSCVFAGLMKTNRDLSHLTVQGHRIPTYQRYAWSVVHCISEVCFLMPMTIFLLKQLCALLISVAQWLPEASSMYLGYPCLTGCACNSTFSQWKCHNIIWTCPMCF